METEPLDFDLEAAVENVNLAQNDMIASERQAERARYAYIDAQRKLHVLVTHLGRVLAAAVKAGAEG